MTTLEQAADLCDNCYTMAAKKKKRTAISDLLRTTIAKSGIPLLTIEQDTGVKRQSIMRFLRSERSLRLDIADKLAAYFDLELRAIEEE